MLFIRIWNYFIRCLWIRKRCFCLFFFRILFEQNKRKYNASSIPTWHYLTDRYKKWIDLCLFSFIFELALILRMLIIYHIRSSRMKIIEVRTFLSILKFLTLTLQRKKLKTKKKTQLIIASIFRNGGPTQGRTGNTRIFSPLLYLLSYRAII